MPIAGSNQLTRGGAHSPAVLRGMAMPELKARDEPELIFRARCPASRPPAAREVVLSSTMALMESVTVSELNRQTARVLERVKAGESVEISEYGRPVARITPAGPTTGVPLLDRLIAQGRAVPASNHGPIPPTPPRDETEENLSLSATLAQLRDEERY
jgi:prevent-host-death family protein